MEITIVGNNAQAQKKELFEYVNGFRLTDCALGLRHSSL